MPSSRPTPHPPPTPTPRGDATRERLLEAAVELLETGGYAAASVASISARARVATGALYRHFPSKAELIAEVFRAVAERELTELYEASARPGTAVEKLNAVVRCFASSALENRRLAWVLVYEPVDPLIDAERLAHRQDYRERLAGLLRIAIEAGEIPDQDADLTSASLIGAISEALVSPLSPVPGEGVSDKDVVAALSAFCLRAIGAADGA
jgi:AcrR family transcriptional regulator